MHSINPQISDVPKCRQTHAVIIPANLLTIILRMQCNDIYMRSTINIRTGCCCHYDICPTIIPLREEILEFFDISHLYKLRLLIVFVFLFNHNYWQIHSSFRLDIDIIGKV